jgi:2-methylcitrate dehydratase PrpD
MEPATPDFADIIAWAWEGPPPGSAADEAARRLLLDSLGCALAGLAHPRVSAFANALARLFPGALRLPGVATGLGPGGAAAALATAMTWDEANDGLARAHGRPGLAVAPIILASGAPLGMARAAYALGYEVASRAGEIWRIRPGMHVDGSWHALGAAAAAARLAGLDAAGVGRAIRLAACQIPFALYAPIAAGMDGRNSYPAHAALLGLTAAAAAEAGMDAPVEGLAEARRLALGLTTPLACEPSGTWLLAEAYVKPFAGVRHAHYAAAAALALRPRLAAQPGEITAIRLATYAEALTYAGNRAPRSAIKAQFSLSWAVAAALLQGDLGPAAYTECALADPALRRLEALVTLEDEPAITASGQRGARLWVEVRGEALTEAAIGVTGDPDRPMSTEAVREKFLRLAQPFLGDAASGAAETLLTGGAEGRLDVFG